ncbi:MAG: response regulator [Planctomycetes bacterium]|jgi:two-component system response regulator VicR|nr:response regulator [Planctomycetota bacterium]
MEAKKKKLLIVEDDKMIGTMYKTKLEQEGFIVLQAEDGSQGLEMAIRDKPDLIMLDVIMPQLDGFTVLQELRSNPSTKHTPIVMLTNLGTDEDKAKGQKFGATDYIVKANLTPSQVSELIKKYLK